METSKSAGAKKVFGILDALQLVIVLVAIVLIFTKVAKWVDDEDGGSAQDGKIIDKCYLGNTSPDGKPIWLCEYALAVALLSLVVNVVVVAGRWKSRPSSTKGARNLCWVEVPKIAFMVSEIVIDAVLAVWWGVMFGIVLSKVGNANAADPAHQTVRNSFVGLAFVEIIAFVIDAILTGWILFPAQQETNEKEETIDI